MIQRDRELLYLDDGTLNTELIKKSIEEFNNNISRLKEFQSYYLGDNNSFKSTRDAREYVGHKPIVNHAKEIVDTITGYLYGQPVTYIGGGEIAEEITDKHFSVIDEDNHNMELGKDQSIFGKAFELITMDDEDYNEGDVYPYLYKLSPLNTFVVYDTSIKKKPMFAVNFNPIKDVNGEIKKYKAIVYTEDTINVFETSGDSFTSSLILKESEQHLFNGIPIIELLNNEYEQSDFENVLGLIDAYNDLQYNRIIDKQDYLDKLLIIINSSLGDDEESESMTLKSIRKAGYLGLDNSDGGSSDAKFINQVMNETDVEVLKKSLSYDIHKIAKVPDLTDESFSGNASGVAQAYKLFGTEQLGNIKERNFKKMLKKRMKLIANVYKTKNKIIDLGEISYNMTRNVPKAVLTEQEKLQILQGTQDILSWETRIRRYDSEIDVDHERELLKQEREEKMEQMSKQFNPYGFKQDTPLNNDETKDKSNSKDELNAKDKEDKIQEDEEQEDGIAEDKKREDK